MKLLMCGMFFIAFNANANDVLCKMNLSSNYNFEYHIKDNKLDYKIESKSKEKIKLIYVEKHGFPNIVGFNLVGSLPDKKPMFLGSAIIDSGSKPSLLDPTLINNYYDFYTEKNNFYSINLFRGVVSPLLGQDSNKKNQYYIEKEIIEGNVNLKDFFKTFQAFLPEANRYNNQQVKIKIKFALDRELNKCAVFEIKPFIYDFDSKFYSDFKDFFTLF